MPIVIAFYKTAGEDRHKLLRHDPKPIFPHTNGLKS